MGSGVIGLATGSFLEAHNQDVTYNDTNANLILELNSKGKKVELNIKNNYDLYWICTAEWHVLNVINVIKDLKPNVVIRSTIKPDVIKEIKKKYKIEHIAHIPEFLRQNTALLDIFNSDRFVIGVEKEDSIMCNLLSDLFSQMKAKKIFCTPEESSLIKLIANAWLALQVSFWNEIRNLCYSYDTINPQLISDTVTLDRRISTYGSSMLGFPFGGACFPKDSKSLVELFKERGVSQNIISAFIKTNDDI